MLPLWFWCMYQSAQNNSGYVTVFNDISLLGLGKALQNMAASPKKNPLIMTKHSKKFSSSRQE